MIPRFYVGRMRQKAGTLILVKSAILYQVDRIISSVHLVVIHGLDIVLNNPVSPNHSELWQHQAR